MQNIQPQFQLSRNQWILIFSVAVFSGMIAFLLWFQKGIDFSVLVAHNAVREIIPVVNIAQAFTSFGMTAISVVVFAYLILAQVNGKFKNAQIIALVILFSFAVAGIAGDLLKEVFNRARPMAEYGEFINVNTMPGTPSFPSGHATKSLALVVPFLFFISNKNWVNKITKYLLALIAIGVCYSRILLGKHYLSDVIAAIGVVFICLPLVVFIANKILKAVPPDQLPKACRIWAVVLLALSVLLIFM